MRKHCFIFIFTLSSAITGSAQLKWQNVDSLFQPLPASVHVYFTKEPIDTGPFRAYYFIAELKDKNLDFTADTSLDRRLTPAKFYERNDRPLVVVNCTFFSYETNRSLNLVVKDGKVVSCNSRVVKGKGADSVNLYCPNLSAIGINKKRNADVAWIKSDSVETVAFASQLPVDPSGGNFWQARRNGQVVPIQKEDNFRKWKMQTAVGGGPVLLQNGEIKITNEEERMFTGKAINDKHPRTAMGYTKDGKLIILVIEGRNKVAHGATLGQEAQIFKDLGCWEALNLDGGGSSCMLVNGKETIKVSDAVGQRPVPAVFLIRQK
jgi:exopolysaccharide biosynthesis protein